MKKNSTIFLLILVLLLVSIVALSFVACKKKPKVDKAPPVVILPNPEPDVPIVEEPKDESNPKQNLLDYYGLSTKVSLSNSTMSLKEQAINISIITNFFTSLEGKDYPETTLRSFSKSLFTDFESFLFSFDKIDDTIQGSEYLELLDLYYAAIMKTATDADLFKEAKIVANSYLERVSAEQKLDYEKYIKYTSLIKYLDLVKNAVFIGEIRYNESIQALKNAGLEPGTEPILNDGYYPAFISNIYQVAKNAYYSEHSRLVNKPATEAQKNARKALEKLVLNTSNYNELSFVNWAMQFNHDYPTITGHTLDWLRVYFAEVKKLYPALKIEVPLTTKGVSKFWVNYAVEEINRAVRYQEKIAYPFKEYYEIKSFVDNPVLESADLYFARGKLGSTLQKILPKYLSYKIAQKKLESFANSLKYKYSDVTAFTKEGANEYIKLLKNLNDTKAAIVNENIAELNIIIDEITNMLQKTSFDQIRDNLISLINDIGKIVYYVPAEKLFTKTLTDVPVEYVDGTFNSLSSANFNTQVNFYIYLAKTLDFIHINGYSDKPKVVNDTIKGFFDVKSSLPHANIMKYEFSSNYGTNTLPSEEFNKYIDVLMAINELYTTSNPDKIKHKYDYIKTELGSGFSPTISDFKNKTQIDTFYSDTSNYLKAMVDEDSDAARKYAITSLQEHMNQFETTFFSDKVKNIASCSPVIDGEDVESNLKTALTTLFDYFAKENYFGFEAADKTKTLKEKSTIMFSFLTIFILNNEGVIHVENYQRLLQNTNHSYNSNSKELIYYVQPYDTGTITLNFSENTTLKQNTSISIINVGGNLTNIYSRPSDSITIRVYAGYIYLIKFTPTNETGTINLAFEKVSYN